MDSQPVADPNPETLCPFDAADSGGQIGAQKASVGGFISESPHSREAHVDGGGCEVLLFEEKPVAKDDSPVKGQTRFGTVPPDEFGFADISPTERPGFSGASQTTSTVCRK